MVVRAAGFLAVVLLLAAVVVARKNHPCPAGGVPVSDLHVKAAVLPEVVLNHGCLHMIELEQNTVDWATDGPASVTFKIAGLSMRLTSEVHQKLLGKDVHVSDSDLTLRDVSVEGQIIGEEDGRITLRNLDVTMPANVPLVDGTPDEQGRKPPTQPGTVLIVSSPHEAVFHMFRSLLADILSSKFVQTFFLPKFRQQLSHNLESLISTAISLPESQAFFKSLFQTKTIGQEMSMDMKMSYASIPFLEAPAAGLMAGLQHAMDRMGGKAEPYNGHPGRLTSELDTTKGIALLDRPMHVKKGGFNNIVYQAYLDEVHMTLSTLVTADSVAVVMKGGPLKQRVHMDTELFGLDVKEMIVEITIPEFEFQFTRAIEYIEETLKAGCQAADGVKSCGACGLQDECVAAGCDFDHVCISKTDNFVIHTPAPPILIPMPAAGKSLFGSLLGGLFSCSSSRKKHNNPADPESQPLFDIEHEHKVEHDTLFLRATNIQYNIISPNDLLTKICNLKPVHRLVEWVAKVVAHNYVDQVLYFEEVQKGLADLSGWAASQADQVKGHLKMDLSVDYRNVPLTSVPSKPLLAALQNLFDNFKLKVPPPDVPKSELDKDKEELEEEMDNLSVF